ncbi:MAG: TetR/AcrR family transcriptional regulator, partial [Alphaproteobacteria bacterium]|nr:TetR/AcrR family transcriptional regulator [Alphaproteobacteria bacterium]
MKKSSPAKPAAGEPMRERILDAAFAAFFEHGYSGASTLDIATRAKISKRELYALFGSKRALLVAGIKERTARLPVPLEFPDIVNRQELERALTALATALLSLLTDEPVLALYR